MRKLLVFALLGSFLLQPAAVVNAKTTEDINKILSGEALDAVFEDMKAALEKGEEVSFGASLEKVGGLNISLKAEYDLSDTSIDMDNLDASLTNLGFSQLSASLAGSYNDVDLSGKAAGCQELFYSQFGDIALSLDDNYGNLTVPGLDMDYGNLTAPDLDMDYGNLTSPDLDMDYGNLTAPELNDDAYQIPSGFNEKEMLSSNLENIKKTYSEAIKTESFQTVKQLVSIGDVFESAKENVEKYSLPSESALKKELGISSEDDPEDKYSDRVNAFNKLVSGDKKTDGYEDKLEDFFKSDKDYLKAKNQVETKKDQIKDNIINQGSDSVANSVNSITNAIEEMLDGESPSLIAHTFKNIADWLAGLFD